MKIARSLKSGKLIIDGKGATIILEPNESINLINLKNTIIKNFNVIRKEYNENDLPYIHIKACKNMILKDSIFKSNK